MQSCDFCGNIDGVSLYKFPVQEEQRRIWLANMGRDPEGTLSESSALCSVHFTPDCFESESALLHPDAIPTVFDCIQTESRILKENVSSHQGKPKDSSRPSCCDCNKRIQETERNYQLKLAAAHLQIKEYKKSLAEESRKATQWQKRVIVLQSAIRAMKQRGSMPPMRKSSTPKTAHLE